MFKEENADNDSIRMPSTSSSALILFTKVPIGGIVKTRLIDRRGETSSPTPEEIAELYRSLLQDTLEAARLALKRTGASLIVSYSPPSGESEIRRVVEEFFDDAEFIAQEGRNVTEKVRSAFEHAFKMGYRSASLIPGDHPDLDDGLLAEAIEGLDSPNPLVILGPTFDGGAFLLGFNRAFL